MTTPRSPSIFGSRGFSLLVPTNTLPPATVGPPYELLPSWAVHLTFFSSPSLTLQSVTMPLAKGLAQLRLGPPPNIGHASAPAASLAGSAGARPEQAVPRSKADSSANGGSQV